jgi:hypothetical protein
MKYLTLILVFLCFWACGKEIDDKKIKTQELDLTVKDIAVFDGLSHVNIYFPEHNGNFEYCLAIKTVDGIKRQGYSIGKVSGPGKIVWNKTGRTIKYAIIYNTGSMTGFIELPEKFELGVGGKITSDEKIYGNGALVAKWGIGELKGDDEIRENELGLVVVIDKVK